MAIRRGGILERMVAEVAIAGLSAVWGALKQRRARVEVADEGGFALGQDRFHQSGSDRESALQNQIALQSENHRPMLQPVNIWLLAGSLMAHGVKPLTAVRILNSAHVPAPHGRAWHVSDLSADQDPPRLSHDQT